MTATIPTDDWRSMRDRNDGRTPNIASHLPLDADHLVAIIGDILDRGDWTLRGDLERLQQSLHVHGVAGTALLERLRTDYPKVSWDSCGAGIYGHCDDYYTRDETFAHAREGLGLVLDTDDPSLRATGTLDGIAVAVRR